MVKRKLLKEVETLSIPPKCFDGVTLAYACAQLLIERKDKRNYQKVVKNLSQHLSDCNNWDQNKNTLIWICNKINKKILFVKYRKSGLKNLKCFIPKKFRKNLLAGVFRGELILYHKKKYFLVKNYEALAREYTCNKCLKTLNRRDNFNVHRCIDLKKEIRLKHTPRIFRPRLTMLEELNDLGMNIPKDRKFIEYFGAYDIETYTSLLRVKKTELMEEIGEQQLANICLASNIPNYEYKVFWNKNNSPRKTIKAFVKHALEISSFAGQHHLKANGDIIAEGYRMYDMAMNEGKKSYAIRINSVIKKFKNYLQKFTLFSYNGANYDLKVMTANSLFNYLHKYDGKVKPTRDTGPNTYLSILSNSLRFVDLIRFLGAPAPLSVALKNFNITEPDLKDLQSNLTEQKCIDNGLKLLFPYGFAKIMIVYLVISPPSKKKNFTLN